MTSECKHKRARRDGKLIFCQHCDPEWYARREETRRKTAIRKSKENKDNKLIKGDNE